MKLYKVEYSGLWLGGIALVFANDEADAILKVKQDSRTTNFVNVVVTEITNIDGVVYNYNGDY